MVVSQHKQTDGFHSFEASDAYVLIAVGSSVHNRPHDVNLEWISKISNTNGWADEHMGGRLGEEHAKKLALGLVALSLVEVGHQS